MRASAPAAAWSSPTSAEAPAPNAGGFAPTVRLVHVQSRGHNGGHSLLLAAWVCQFGVPTSVRVPA